MVIVVVENEMAPEGQLGLFGDGAPVFTGGRAIEWTRTGWRLHNSTTRAVLNGYESTTISCISSDHSSRSENEEVNQLPHRSNMWLEYLHAMVWTVVNGFTGKEAGGLSAKSKNDTNQKLVLLEMEQLIQNVHAVLGY